MRKYFVNIDAARPYEKAGVISRIFFGWMYGFLRKGLKQPLKFKDLYGIPEQDKVGPVADTLQREWQKEHVKTTSAFYRALLRTFGRRYLWCWLIHLSMDTMLFIMPLLFQNMSDRFFDESSESGHCTVESTDPNNSSVEYSDSDNFPCEFGAHKLQTVWLYAIGFGVCVLAQPFLSQWSFYFRVTIGLQIRGATMSLLYRKILRLSSSSLSETTVGQIISLASNDIPPLVELGVQAGPLIDAPIFGILILWYAFNQVGVAIFAGLLVLLLTGVMQYYAAAMAAACTGSEMRKKDARIKLTNDVIVGIETLKLNCWEKTFQEIIEDTRKDEAGHLLTGKCYWLITRHMTAVNARVIAMVMLGSSYFLHGATPLATAFTFMALLYRFDRVVTNKLGNAAKEIMEINVHINRITNILSLDEAEAVNEIVQVNKRSSTDHPSVVLNTVTASWGQHGLFRLSDITLNVGDGELVALIGHIGSGKSSLLQCILGEMQTISGRVTVNGRLAYVSQKPWIFSDTLRENVLFGREFDERKYLHVIYQTALNRDIRDLSLGDKTIVGERGVILSGGQKSRVSLARALYSDADVYLLDDPLSAVDAAVGEHIFEKCINDGLRGKARILVTNQLQYLTEVDRIVVLEQGKIIACGTYSELCEGDNEVARLLPLIANESGRGNDDDSDDDKCNDDADRFHNEDGHKDKEENVDRHEDDQSRPDQSSPGSVGLSHLWTYLRVGMTFKQIMVLVALSITAQTVYSLADCVLAMWVRGEFHKDPITDGEFTYTESPVSQSNLRDQVCFQPTMASIFHFDAQCHLVQSPSTRQDVADWSSYTKLTMDSSGNVSLAVYMILTLLAYVLSLTCGRVYWRNVLHCSTKLHNMMIYSLVRAPLRYFDTSTTGNILKPFSVDMAILDGNLPFFLYEFFVEMLMVFGSLTTIAWANPWLILVILPLAALQYLLYHVYEVVFSQVEHLHSSSKAPMHSYLSATMQGLPDIRSYHAQSHCQENFERCINHYHGADLNGFWVFNWYYLNTELVAAILINLTVLITMIMSTSAESRSYAGLCMLLSLQIVQNLRNFLRSLLGVKTLMGSVERVLETTRLTSEGNWHSDHPLPTKWPQHGDITLKSLSLRYSDDGPIVLKNINGRIEANEKIGIVGRTGAGKSSLIRAILRLDTPTGHVFIDGVNVMDIGLHDLREKVSVIPQDPVLYSGSLWRNLDPAGHHTREDIWSALKQVQLSDYFMSQPDGLYSEVSEGGSNLSAGQRQLVCLARAILRKGRILILDEATANVDTDTDALIQKCLQEHFSDCTILTIAHRLHTITDASRIMVMDSGRLVQFGTPRELLRDERGVFAKLMEQTGSMEKQRLIEQIMNSDVPLS